MLNDGDLNVLKNGDLNHQKWRLFMIFAGKAGDLKEKYDGLIWGIMFFWPITGVKILFKAEVSNPW